MHGVGGEVRFFLPWVPLVKPRLSGGAISLSLLVCLRNIKLVCTVSQNDVGLASSSDVVGRKGKSFSSWY